MKTEILDNRKMLMADEGMKLTDWNGENIMDYSSCTMLVTPLHTDLSMYYEITDEQDAEYLKEQEERINELNDER